MTKRIVSSLRQWRPSGPHNLDEHTWWYREANGSITLVHEDRNAAGEYVKSFQWRIGLSGVQRVLARSQEPHKETP